MKKKFLAMAVSLIMASTCMGCFSSSSGQSGGGGGIIVEGGDKIELPDYDLKKDELKFLTTAFFSPKISEASVQEYMDCGFDVLCINGNNVGYGNSAEIRKALQIAQDKNLKCVIDATVSRDADRIEQSMICNDFGYQNYTSLWAVNGFDEPVTKQGDYENVVGIDTISKYIPKFTSIYGEKMPFFINLNPFGASRIKDYNAYIKANVDDIIKKTSPKSEKWISCDSYVLIYNPMKDLHFLKPTWLCNLQLIANTKQDYPDLGIKSNFYILSTPHQTGNVDSYMRDIGYEELSVQLYTLIAFGYDMASFFTYATPISAGGETYTPALVDKDGNKTQRWYDSQQILTEIHKFDHVFMQFKNKGVYAVEGSTDNYSNGSFDYLTSLKINDLGELKDVSASADTVVGVGRDEKGNYGYTVVNYNDPHYNVKDGVTMTFERANNAIVYIKGEKVIKELENHTLKIDVENGQGVFVIPY